MASRPEALVDLPRFNGDQLVPERTGGDLSIQACADDPQVAFHAVRQLARLAYGAAQIRWAQTGFVDPGDAATRRATSWDSRTARSVPRTRTARHLGGRRDGPDWMRGGTYLVVRRIRMALEHWDGTEVGIPGADDRPAQILGRAAGEQGRVRPDEPRCRPTGTATRSSRRTRTSVWRRRRPTTARQILRRGYSYNDGVNFTAERWPPWRQGMEYDAGLLFVCLSDRSPHGLHQDLRQDGEVRHAQPVRDAHGRRHLRLPGRDHARVSSSARRCSCRRDEIASLDIAMPVRPPAARPGPVAARCHRRGRRAAGRRCRPSGAGPSRRAAIPRTDRHQYPNAGIMVRQRLTPGEKA